MDNLSGQGHIVRIFSHKHIFYVAVLSLAFMVTGSNLYASTVPAKVDDTEEYHNLLMKMVRGIGEELLIEDTDYDPGSAKDIGYLDSFALDIRDYYVSQEIDEDVPTESDMYGIDYSEYAEVAINAVRDFPASAEEMPSVLTRTRIVEYEVQSGENAGSIARKFGLSTSTILASNGLNSRSVLKIGRKLSIPPVDGIIYTIKKGDTLIKLADKYDSEPEKIAEINGISPDDLSVGMELVLPGGRLPPPPPAPKKVATQYSSSHTTYTAPSPDLMSDTKLLWPTSARRISQYYKWGHSGLDIAGPMRTPLYASESGTVIFSGWNSGGYGNMVLIDHGGSLYTRYAHATQLLVKQGDKVSRGDTIALMGSTGRSTGPHIHFEVLVGSIYNRVNPLDYIQ